jgi:hypothetical protein
MATAGGWGKMKRRPRGFDSRAHLGLGRCVEAALRAVADWRWGISGGGAPVLRQGREVAVMVRGDISSSRSSSGRQWWFRKNPGVDSGRRYSRSIRCCGTQLVVQVHWPWPRRGGAATRCDVEVTSR